MALVVCGYCVARKFRFSSALAHLDLVVGLFLFGPNFRSSYAFLQVLLQIFLFSRWQILVLSSCINAVLHIFGASDWKWLCRTVLTEQVPPTFSPEEWNIQLSKINVIIIPDDGQSKNMSSPVCYAPSLELARTRHLAHMGMHNISVRVQNIKVQYRYYIILIIFWRIPSTFISFDKNCKVKINPVNTRGLKFKGMKRPTYQQES